MNLHFPRTPLIQYFEDLDHRLPDWPEQYSDEQQGLKIGDHSWDKYVAGLYVYQDDDIWIRYDYIQERGTESK